MQSSTTKHDRDELKFALYERKYNQDDAVSVKSLQHSREFARRTHLIVIEEVIDRRNKKRHEFTRLIEEIEKGSVNAILCRGMHGISRQLMEIAELASLIKSGKLKSIRTPDRDLMSPVQCDSGNSRMQ